MPRPFKSPRPLLPADNLDFDDSLEPGPTVRERCEAACRKHIRTPSLRAAAMGVLARARAWRLNAARIASDRDMRRKLRRGAAILTQLTAVEKARGSDRTSLLKRLLRWLESLDLDTRLLLGGHARHGSPGATSSPLTRLDALRSVERLAGRLELEIRDLRGRDAEADGGPTAIAFDPHPMHAHLTRLADAIPRGRDGRRQPETLSWLVQQLATIWEADRKVPFRRSGKNPQYGFVADLCRAIEPDLDRSRLATAIRAAAARRPKSGQ